MYISSQLIHLHPTSYFDHEFMAGDRAESKGEQENGRTGTDSDSRSNHSDSASDISQSVGIPVAAHSEAVETGAGGMTAEQWADDVTTVDELAMSFVGTDAKYWWREYELQRRARNRESVESSREIQQLKNDCIRLAQERSALIERAESAEGTVAELRAQIKDHISAHQSATKVMGQQAELITGLRAEVERLTKALKDANEARDKLVELGWRSLHADEDSGLSAGRIK